MNSVKIILTLLDKIRFKNKTNQVLQRKYQLEIRFF